MEQNQKTDLTLHWGEDEFGHNRHKAQIGGVLQWCLSFCRFLRSSHMIMELNSSDHQVLGHHSNQSPSPSNDQFGQEASSKKNPSCSKRLPLWIMEATCFCDPSMQQIFFWTLPQTCGLTQSYLWALQTSIFFTSGLVFALICTFSCY